MVVAVILEANVMALIFLMMRWPRPIHPIWLAIIFLPLLWMGINYAVSYTGGWWDLAKTYPLVKHFPEKHSWRASQAFLSALGSYRNLVDVAVDSEGLYL